MKAKRPIWLTGLDETLRKLTGRDLPHEEGRQAPWATAGTWASAGSAFLGAMLSAIRRRPTAQRHLRSKRLQIEGGEVERSPPLRTLVRGHEGVEAFSRHSFHPQTFA
jgi:hypothetical protein